MFVENLNERLRCLCNLEIQKSSSVGFRWHLPSEWGHRTEGREREGTRRRSHGESQRNQGRLDVQYLVSEYVRSSEERIEREHMRLYIDYIYRKQRHTRRLHSSCIVAALPRLSLSRLAIAR